MILHPWTHPTSTGLTLRGWHSPASGKPVLHFIHANGFCGRTYEPMLRHLATHFDLWLVDLQGHGASDQGGEFLGWHENALLALEVLPHATTMFGKTPEFAVGHSFGGVATAYLLAQQPVLFQRAVLLDPVLFTPALLVLMAASYWWRGVPASELAARTLKRRRTWPDRDAARFDLYDRGIFKGWSEDSLQAYVEHALKDDADGVSLCCDPAQEAAIFSKPPRGLWPALGRVQTPTLVVHGERSYPFVARSAQRWQRRNPHIQQQQVPGGHCFMQQFPAESARHIADFLLA